MFDRNIRTPYLHQYNFSTQIEVLKNFLLEVGYVGTTGANLFRQVGINQARLASPSSPITNAVTGQVSTTNTPGNASLRAPFQGVSVNGFFQNQTTADSKYDSLQTSLTRRFANGLQFLASYTLSKSTDNASGQGGGPGAGGVLNPGAVGETSPILGNQLDYNANRGRSDFDRTHRFVFSALYDLPTPKFAQGSEGGKLLFGNWQIASIVTSMSGLIDGGYLLSMPVGADAEQVLDSVLSQRIEQLQATYPSREVYRDFWRSRPNFPPSDWGPWTEAFLDYEVGGEAPQLRPKAAEAAVRFDVAESFKADEITARLKTLRVPVKLLRAAAGFAADRPPLIPDAAVEEMRAFLPNLEDEMIPGTTHYTIVLGERGASRVADLIEEFAGRRPVTALLVTFTTINQLALYSKSGSLKGWAMHGRVALRQLLSPIPKVQTPARKCGASFVKHQKPATDKHGLARIAPHCW